MNSSLKVFVRKATDETKLKDELIYLNKNFFERYRLEIEKSKMVMKQTLMQGESLLTEANYEDHNYCEGTLGGFVTKVDNKTKIYALTCNHLFPETNKLAYMGDHQNIKEIGFYVFTTREQSCDFAAIEINGSLVNENDIAFRRDDKKKTNAKVNTKSFQNVGIVHKIGKKTDVTTGIVLSPEYYDKFINESNKEYLFLVKGTNGKFSEEGDSGSLVFCRPRSVQQTHVDILGMVYANNLTVNDDDDDDGVDDDDDHNDENDEQTKYFPNEGAIKTEVKAENASCTPTPLKNDSIASANNAQNHENIACCYRIDTALELFEYNYSEQFKVKFQDDLSQSSNSDDSNEEHSE